MSRHREELGLQVSSAYAMTLCRRVVRDLGWTEVELGETWIVAAEHQKLVSTVNYVTVQIDLEGDPQGFTRTTVQGSNFGFGPIQKAHVQRQVHLFANRIELAAAEADETIDGPRPVVHHPWAFSLRVPDQMKQWLNTFNEFTSTRETKVSPGRMQEQGSLSAELERLADLRHQGILTEEEFQRAKSQIIDG